MKFLLIILCFANFTVSNGQSIRGKIVDGKKKDGISYGIITLLSDKKDRYVEISDEKGHFIFNDVIPGNYAITFSSVGYPDTSFGVFSIMQDTILNFVYFNFCEYDASKNNKRCPICHKKNSVIPIIYGIPFSPEGKDPTKGNGIKFLLAGCEISYCDPNWYCKRDKVSF